MSFFLQEDLLILQAYAGLGDKIRPEDNSYLPKSVGGAGPFLHGAYRHAYPLGPGPSWSMQQLGELASDMVDSGQGGNEQGTLNPPAGYTYFGQFVTHDLSNVGMEDPLGRLEPGNVVNRREPKLNLEGLYGLGPKKAPVFYRRSSPGEPNSNFGEFRIGGRSDAAHLSAVRQEMVKRDDDLLRSSRFRALIPDDRNDENVMVSQIHLGFQKAHNAILRRLRGDAQGQGHQVRERGLFQAARTQLTWHYQWLVLNDLLRQRVLAEPVAEVLEHWLDDLKAGRAYRGPIGERRVDRWLPLEFVLGAFRFGHSMVRSSYRLNGSTRQPIATVGRPNFNVSHHLRGGRKLVGGWTLDWDYFFSRGKQQSPYLQHARLFVDSISSELSRLPADGLERFLGASSGAPKTHNLAWLTLFAGAAMGLPTGQELAKEFQRRRFDVEVYDEGSETPLWRYLLAESKRDGFHGNRLGLMGSWIVLETIFGLLISDPLSYLNQNPKFTPCYGDQAWDQEPETYGVGTLLRFGEEQGSLQVQT